MVSSQEQATKPNQQAKADHTFRAIHDDEIPWQDVSRTGQKLPEGMQVKVLSHDKSTGRIDMKAKFAPGYVEPEHTHKGWHSIVVLRGRMCVAGKDLRPGDYVFGWEEIHGPFEYPDGCEVFCSFVGESVAHIYDEGKFKAHQNVWKAETEEGRRGVDQYAALRKKG